MNHQVLVYKRKRKKKKNCLKILSLFKKISKSFTNVHDLDLNSDPDLDLDSDFFFRCRFWIRNCIKIKRILSTDFQKDISHYTKVDT